MAGDQLWISCVYTELWPIIGSLRALKVYCAHWSFIYLLQNGLSHVYECKVCFHVCIIQRGTCRLIGYLSVLTILSVTTILQSSSLGEIHTLVIFYSY